MLLARTTAFFLLVCAISGAMRSTLAQSQRRPRESTYGANITVALYYYDQTKSKPVEAEIRLPTTFSEAEQERTYLTNHFGLVDLGLRHAFGVGLREGERYETAERFGGDLLLTTLNLQSATRGRLRLSLVVRYGTKVMLERTGLEMESFESVALRGSEGLFGLKNFEGPQGPESASALRALLVTVTVQTDLESRLTNKPYDLSHLVDEHGSPVPLGPADHYTPPAVLERIVPVLPPSRRAPPSVLLEGIVTPEGKITNVAVLRSVDKELDKIAVDAFRRFSFRPATLNEKPVYATIRQELSFLIPAAGPPPPPRGRRRRFPLQSGTRL